MNRRHNLRTAFPKLQQSWTLIKVYHPTKQASWGPRAFGPKSSRRLRSVLSVLLCTLPLGTHRWNDFGLKCVGRGGLIKHPLGAEGGFTIVELILACIIVPIVVIGIATAFNGIKHSYITARELNEMYAVLSACPEVDRALEFNSLSTGTNCYPNNSFVVENVTSGPSVTYSPTLTVTDTSALSAGDPLVSIPDSKVVEIQVNFLPPAASSSPLQLRMLITRNGIGQL